MLEVQNLQVEKSGQTICQVPQLAVRREQRLAIVGPNGSGKTTLLRVLSGLEPDFRGEVVTEISRRNRVYVHQSPYLFRRSVLFNVSYGLAARRVPRKAQALAAREWLGAFHVAHLAQHHSSKLSGGERRRVALARAFATEAALLLLDEPLADLDSEGMACFARAVAMSRSTILISSPTDIPDGFSSHVLKGGLR